MKIRTLTTTFSLHSGDHDFDDKGVEFVNKLLFNCKSLEKIPDNQKNIGWVEISSAKYELTGKVIVKGEYLLIVEGPIRIGVVVNNAFRAGNHVYMGNNEIDHAELEVGDMLRLTGSFIFSPVHFCVFTFNRTEHELPVVDYKWKATKFYRIDFPGGEYDEPEIENIPFERYEEIEILEGNHNVADDLNLVELELVDPTPVTIDQKFVGISGYYSSINWIEPSKWIKNCGGRILEGVKVDEWFYYDKRGKEKTVINYKRES